MRRPRGRGRKRGLLVEESAYSWIKGLPGKRHGWWDAAASGRRAREELAGNGLEGRFLALNLRKLLRKPNLVAAVIFGPIQCSIGLAEQLIGVRAVGRIKRDPD